MRHVKQQQEILIKIVIFVQCSLLQNFKKPTLEGTSNSNKNNKNSSDNNTKLFAKFIRNNIILYNITYIKIIRSGILRNIDFHHINYSYSLKYIRESLLEK